LTNGDWRLPNVRELYSLVHCGEFYPPLPNSEGTDQWIEGDPFTTLAVSAYWSSTTLAIATEIARMGDQTNGNVPSFTKSTTFSYVWPVRGETNGPAPVPKTGQTNCYDESGVIIDCAGTGQDGELRKGVAWPEPRFTDNGDGTVTDNLTRLMWTKDANIFGPGNWDNAISNCNDFELVNYTDWRLPNVREMESLIDYGSFDPALPLGHPFTGVDYWSWSSTTLAGGIEYAWYLGISDQNEAIHASDPKSDTMSMVAWPVRGGH
jgi:hypothetical protein